MHTILLSGAVRGGHKRNFLSELNDMGYHIGMIFHWLPVDWLKKQQKKVQLPYLLAESRVEACTYLRGQIELIM